MDPQPSLRVLIVANACQWASWPDKIAAIKAFYAPLVALDIDIQYTNFTQVPTQQIEGQVTTFGPTGYVDTTGTDIDVSTDWLTQNIIPLANGYDIVVFQTATIAPEVGLPLGITIGKLSGVWCSMTFTTSENSIYELPGSYYTPPQTGMVNLGDQATIIIEHELSHALYELSAETDNTHKYFYTGQFSRVLTDIKLPNQTALIGLYQNLVQDLEEELGLLKAQQTAPINDSNPSDSQNSAVPEAQAADTSPSTFPPKILAWAKIIGIEEGADPALDNPGDLKLSDLTKSWGALQGIVASDGGTLAKFPTEQAGEIALCDFLVLGCQNQLLAFHSPAARTLAGFMQIFAGNPPAGYTDAIVQAMGGDPNVQISTFLS